MLVPTVTVIPERKGGVLVIRTEGRVDASNAHLFHDQINFAISSADKNIVLDLEGLEYISSAGLRIVLMVSKETRRVKSRFAVCSLSETVEQVFQISGFGKIMAIYDSREEAIARLSSRDILKR